jgi:hypothetical protein
MAVDLVDRCHLGGSCVVYEQDDVDTEAGIVADTEGFEEFYVATVGRLLGQLLPVTGDLHEAEEVVQEAVALPRCPGK